VAGKVTGPVGSIVAKQSILRIADDSSFEMDPVYEVSQDICLLLVRSPYDRKIASITQGQEVAAVLKIHVEVRIQTDTCPSSHHLRNSRELCEKGQAVPAPLILSL
jgi:hypothetical protein